MENVVLDMSDLTMEEIMTLFGENDCHLNLLEDHFSVSLETAENYIVCSNPDKVEQVGKVLSELVKILNMKHSLTKEDVHDALNNNGTSVFFKKAIGQGFGGRKFYLRSAGQKKLYEAFDSHDITFAIGPAGTGKTFLAVIYACNQLREGLIKKIIVTRPVVEAGESLGFLPGDLKEKVDPYLRPIYDSLEALYGPLGVSKLMEKDIIEIAPLAYMRGRTLNDAVIILDEAQNTTEMQLKMFLTRLGFNAKMIVTGDITQVDLPSNKKSGLMEAANIVKGIDEIAVCFMGQNDVVRHPVVQKLIDAYEKKEKHK